MPTISRLTGGAVAVVVAAAGAVVAAAPATARPAAPPVSSNAVPVGMLLIDGGQTLVSYQINTGTVGAQRAITNLTNDTALVGIDFRVQDGQLYGVGNKGGIYQISPAAVAKKIKNLSVRLDGTRFGVDFNPAANALRVISNTGQNLRQSFATISAATAVDTPLNYTAGTTATGVVAAGYTNNDLTDTTGTTLFDIDAALDQVVVQAPANNGSLSVTGKLGADVNDIGFDIFTTLDSSGRANGNTGYAIVPGEASSTLHQIALLTGEAPLIRSVPVVATDIAVALVTQPAGR